jgi:hypothetical protein
MVNLKITRPCQYCGAALKPLNPKHCSRACQFAHWNQLIPERFMALVEKTATCWLWKGGTFDDWGYGIWPKKGWPKRTHRMSWQIHFGPIPNDMKVLHCCDNPPCVRPDHLFLGTDKDNHDDMVSKGRRKEQRGSQHGLSKLTEDRVRELRTLRSQGLSYRALGRIFSIDASTAHAAVNGGWKHVIQDSL